MRRGGFGRPNVAPERSQQFCCDCVSASLRPSASRAWQRVIDQLFFSRAAAATPRLVAAFTHSVGEQRPILDLVGRERHSAGGGLSS